MAGRQQAPNREQCRMHLCNAQIRVGASLVRVFIAELAFAGSPSQTNRQGRFMTRLSSRMTIVIAGAGCCAHRWRQWPPMRVYRSNHRQISKYFRPRRPRRRRTPQLRGTEMSAARFGLGHEPRTHHRAGFAGAEGESPAVARRSRTTGARHRRQRSERRIRRARPHHAAGR